MGCIPTKNKRHLKSTILSGDHSEKDIFHQGSSNIAFYKAENQVYKVTVLPESELS